MLLLTDTLRVIYQLLLLYRETLLLLPLILTPSPATGQLLGHPILMQRQHLGKLQMWEPHF